MGICQSANSKYVFVGLWNKAVKIWDVETWKCVETVPSITVKTSRCRCIKKIRW